VKVRSFSCDVCQRTKGEVNRWWIISLGSSLILQPWDSATPEDIDKADHHLCGEAHAQQIIAGWMAKASKVTIEGAQ